MYRRIKEDIEFIILPIAFIPIPIPFVNIRATVNPNTGKKDTTSDLGSIVYGVSTPQVNSNFTQFIPYGIDNFYFTQNTKRYFRKILIFF